MLPQVARAARRYGVRVMSGSGMVALRAWHRLGIDAAESEQKTVLLWVGDLDLPGIRIYQMAAEDSRAWCEDAGGDPDDIIAERITVTPDQVAEHGLETAPEAKRHTHAQAQLENARRICPADVDWLLDGAQFRGRESIIPAAQAEAVPPDIRADIIRAAIERHLDMDQFNANRKRSTREAAKVRKLMTGMTERLGAFVEGELRNLPE